MRVIELPDDQAEALTAKAALDGLTLETWLKRMADEDASNMTPQVPPVASAAPQKSLAEKIDAIWSDVSPEDWETLPIDGASEHDHYIYGLPKRTV